MNERPRYVCNMCFFLPYNFLTCFSFRNVEILEGKRKQCEAEISQINAEFQDVVKTVGYFNKYISFCRVYYR